MTPRVGPLRCRDGGEDGVDDRFDVDVVGDGLETEPDTVPEARGGARSRTSSGTTNVRPFNSASALDACCKAIAPRGLAPSSM